MRTNSAALPGRWPISLRTSENPARSSASETPTGSIESWRLASVPSASRTASTPPPLTKPCTPLDRSPGETDDSADAPGNRARRARHPLADGEVIAAAQRPTLESQRRPALEDRPDVVARRRNARDALTGGVVVEDHGVVVHRGDRFEILRVPTRRRPRRALPPAGARDDLELTRHAPRSTRSPIGSHLKRSRTSGGAVASSRSMASRPCLKCFQPS
jgi:hypothetical protein